MSDEKLIHELRNSKGWPTLGNAAADRIEELKAELRWVLDERDATFALMLNRAAHAEKMWGETEVKLAKALEALGEAIYLLDPDEEDIAKETGLHRIVTTYAELTGGKDE